MPRCNRGGRGPRIFKPGFGRRLAVFQIAFAILCLWALAVAARAEQNQPVAMVDGQPISASDLAAATAGKLATLRNQEYEIQSRALDTLIRQRVLESAAQQQGVSPEALLLKQADSSVGEPTEAEVFAYYLAQPDRGRQPFDQVKVSLRSALHRAAILHARDAYIDRLRAQANVVVLLERSRVPVAFDPARLEGNAAAPIVLVEFSDYQCPYCRRQQPIVDRVLAKYSPQVAFAYRDFPVSESHPLAEQAAEASHCAAQQDKFWPFQRRLMTGELDTAALKQDARDLQLDPVRFDRCLDSGQSKAAIQADLHDAETLGVSATPTFFLNGLSLVGAQSEEALSQAIDQELARQRSRSSAAQSSH